MSYLKPPIIIALLIFSSLSAQHQHSGHGKGKPTGCEIHGSVMDSTTNQPIEYASISIMTIDGTIETGGITNSNGEFHVDGIKPGTYSLKAEFMGYTPIIIANIQLSYRNQREKDVGKIILIPSVLQLEAVKVIDEKPIFEFETDKMVYNSSEDIISDSGTAEDVLNKVPMVTVDQDGEVALRGNANVKILVNGRPNRTGEGGKSVDNIPASLIDKVEVITSPSAKYDPDGMAGIINIVLKKGKYEGFNGNLKINGKSNKNATMNDMNGFTAYGNYKGEKWNLYSSINVNNRLRIMDGYRNVTTTYIIDSPSTPLPIDFSFVNESDRVGSSFKLGADYSITEHLIINGEINYDKHLHEGMNTQNNISPINYVKEINENDFDENYDIEGYFELNQTFENPDKELIFSLSYDFQTDNEFESLINETRPNDTTFLYQDMSGINMDLSYKHPFNEKSKIEIGYDGKINANKETMNFDIGDYVGKNTFNYDRSIHGFFFEHDYQLNEKFSIKPSIRFEYVSKDISYQSLKTSTGNSDMIYATILDTIGIAINDSVRAETYKDIDRTFYPNLHFTYNLNEKQSLQFGLSKRINRPGDGGHGQGSRQIRPFPRDVYSDNFIFMGNPFLKPEFSTQYELSFKSPIPMGFAYINLYYHQLENVIEWYDDDRFDDSDILTFRNADSGENMGVEFFTMLMGQVLGGGYNLSKLEDPSGDYELNGNSQRITLYNRINLPEEYIKLFSFEFGFFFMKMAVPGGDLFGAKGSMWANTGISKSLLNESLEISLGINNLFDNGGFQMKREKPFYDEDGQVGTDDDDIHYATEFTDVATNRGGRTFKLNVIYRFGKMQDEKRRGRHSDHGDEGSMDMGY